MAKYDETKKKVILVQQADSKSAPAIAVDSCISRSTIYAWVKADQQNKPEKEYTYSQS